MFSVLMDQARHHEEQRRYGLAAAVYLCAASHAADRVGEDIALTYAWWMAERAEGRLSEEEAGMTSEDKWDATPQGDGDPSPTSEAHTPPDDAEPVS